MFYQMLYRHDQCKEIWILQSLPLKFLFQNKNIETISKIVNLKKIYLQFSYICLCNLYEISWFYHDFKNGNLCFSNLHCSLYQVLAARILDLSLDVMLSSPKWGPKHLYNSKGLSLHIGTAIIFLLFRSQVHQCFKIF